MTDCSIGVTNDAKGSLSDLGSWLSTKLTVGRRLVP
jgi:hypothetical protein